MLVAPKSKLFNASLEFHPMLFSTEKIHFQKLAGSNYKNYWRHADQVNGKLTTVSYLLNLTPLGLPHIKSLALKDGQIHV